MDWRDGYHRIKGPPPAGKGTRDIVDGLTFIFDGDRMAPELDRPVGYVYERPQDEPTLEHIAMSGVFVCGTAAPDMRMTILIDENVSCPVCSGAAKKYAGALGRMMLPLRNWRYVL